MSQTTRRFNQHWPITNVADVSPLLTDALQDMWNNDFTDRGMIKYTLSISGTDANERSYQTQSYLSAYTRNHADALALVAPFQSVCNEAFNQVSWMQSVAATLYASFVIESEVGP